MCIAATSSAFFTIMHVWLADLPVPIAKYLNSCGPGRVGTALAFNTLPKRSVTALGITNGIQTGFRRQKKNNYKNNTIEIQ
jgi:hypothetical protein